MGRQKKRLQDSVDYDLEDISTRSDLDIYHPNNDVINQSETYNLVFEDDCWD